MDDDIDIDIDALQAQLDISSSLADDLVASWIKPAVKNRLGSSGSNGRLTEKDLEEYAAGELMGYCVCRLGVGASVPETAAVQGREAMRLKGQLLGSGKGKGKKRDREDGGDGEVRRGDESEEESRAGAVRKKVKVDPFAGKKKGKGKVVGAQGQPSAQQPGASGSSASKAGSDLPNAGVSLNSAATVPSLSSVRVAGPSGKIREHLAPSGASPAVNSNNASKRRDDRAPQAPVAIEKPGASSSPTSQKNKKHLKAGPSVPPASDSANTKTTASGPPPSSERQTSNTSASPDKHPGSPLPVLNLHGPPALAHLGPSEGGEGTQKKRRRRKKKKTKNTAEAQDASRD
ncbi:hypothetical protein OE88DRAFT_1731142 [Heliocybe sulcata]|uniref:Uncharacterized protein n=1 Tax=Heliocybe sulcata TaxID=5364 RepID=A0A5C3NH99_9AGAM|nr:hypothetical protein OE88DRAFT_1731142 [Heliocybe sulcata]